MNTLNNKVQLIGRLGSIPTFYAGKNGIKAVRFSIATYESYRNRRGKKVRETTWHNAIAYGKTIDTINRCLDEGSDVVVEGKLVYRSYAGPDGTRRHITEIRVHQVLGRAGNGKTTEEINW